MHTAQLKTGLNFGVCSAVISYYPTLSINCIINSEQAFDITLLSVTHYVDGNESGEYSAMRHVSLPLL